MSFIYCTSGAIVRKAGVNVSTLAATSSAFLQQVSDEAEALIAVSGRWSASGAYTGMTAEVKNILSECSSCLAAIPLIIYDMSGYTSRGEAESMITVLRDTALRDLAILRDKKVQDFL